MTVQTAARDAKHRVNRNIKRGVNHSAHYVRDSARHMRRYGANALKKTEREMKTHPATSAAIAFAAGAALSYFFGRRV